MADPKIKSTEGWSHLQHTMSKKMPRALHASFGARRGLMALTRGRGRK